VGEKVNGIIEERNLQNFLKACASIKFTNSGLSFFLFYFSFFTFISFYFLVFPFLEHRVRVRLQDAKNKVEGSRTNDVIQHGHHMLASCTTHGCLG